MGVTVSGPRVLRFRLSWHHTAFYAADPSLATLPFDAQQAALDANHLAFSASLTTELRAVGVDIHDAIYDVPALRSAWFAEHGRPYETGDERRDFAFAVIAHHRPEIVYEQAFGLLTAEDRREIRRRFPSVRHFVVHSVGPSVKKIGGVDLVLAGCDYLRDMYLGLGVPDVRILHHGFDAGILDEIDLRAPTRPFVFAGTSGSVTGKPGASTTWSHWSRYVHLRALLERTPLECWIREVEITDRPVPAGTSGGSVLNRRGRIEDGLIAALSRLPSGLLDRLEESSAGAERGAMVEVAARRHRARARGADGRDVTALPTANRPPEGWSDARPLRETFPDRCHEPVFGLEMFQLLRDARIVFHKAQDGTGECAGALRLFETTGVGSLLLVNDSPEIPDLFVPGTEIVTYRSVDECAALVEELLEDEPRRAAIAAAGQARTLRDHTIARRAQTVRDELREAFDVA